MKKVVVLGLMGGGFMLAGLVAACSSDGTPANNTVDAGGEVDASREAAPLPPAPDAESDSSTGPDVAAEVAKLDDEIADAVCTKLTSCCNPGDYAVFFGQFKDPPYDLKEAPKPSDCKAALVRQYGRIHDKWVGSVARGRMQFDGARGRTCRDAVKTATCGSSLAGALYNGDCFALRRNAVFPKTAALGSDCQDIGDGTYYGECNPAFGFCGTEKKCVAWKKTGEECQVVPTRAFCAPELSCDGATPTKPGKCSVAPIAVKIGDKCLTDTGAIPECPADAFCDFGTGNCLAKKADGAACQFDDECATPGVFTCYPFGNGTCGRKVYCDGNIADAGAGG